MLFFNTFVTMFPVTTEITKKKGKQVSYVNCLFIHALFRLQVNIVLTRYTFSNLEKIVLLSITICAYRSLRGRST